MTWDSFLHDVLIPGLVNIAWRLVAAAFIFVIGAIVIRFVIKRLKHGRFAERAEHTVQHFVIAFVRIALYVMLTVLVVAVLGVPMASIVAVIGSAGLAISLAVQGTLSNLASGIMILVFKPFKEGDYVEADGVGGTVTELGIFYTTLTTPDNKQVVIPNGNVTSNVLTNYSAKDTRRVEAKFNVDRSTDLDAAKRIISDTLTQNESILTDPAPFIRMTEVKDHAVVITVRVWCDRTEYWNVNFYMVESIYQNLKNEGIEIPYPKMDVNIKDKI